jgi:hypothetical protein
MSKSNTRARADGLFTGNVGIGVTPEAWSGTVYALQLGEDTALYNDSGYTILANNAYLSGGNKYLSTGAASRHYQVSGTHKFEVAPSGTADAAISFTTAMTIDNAGIVTKPYQPAFLAYKTNPQTNIAVGISTIVFDTERFDQSGDFNTSTSTFTAPVTGKYQFNLNIRIGSIDTAAAYYRTYITTSNEAYYPTIIAPKFTADLSYYHLCFSVLADMDAGDTAYTRVQQSGGTEQADLDSGAGQTNFSGYLVA